MSTTNDERHLVFDTDEKTLTNGLKLNKTTKKHGKAVALVQAQNSSLSDESRAKYAKQAGLFRGDPDAELEDTFDSYTAAAALAEVLFEGCPPLLNSAGEVINEELFDCLDEGVVNACFFDFRRKQSGMKSGLLS